MTAVAGIFSASSTAEDVLQGVDLRGKRILVTGVSAGIGVETARALAAHGATVVGAVRDLEKARAATAFFSAATRGSLELVELDLASLRSVRACADTLLAAGKPFACIIANAGVMASPQGTTEDGFETQLGINHLGHFVLVNRLAGLLEHGGRFISISSAGHRGADIDLEDLNGEHTPYDPLAAYRRSKTANILFAVEFDRRHRAKGIRATAVHPGAIETETPRKLIAGMKAAGAAIPAFDWKTPEQGAATTVWAGVMAAGDAVGGRYCEDCHVAAIADDPAARSGVRSYALDAERARALWAKSEEMVGESFP